MITLTDTVTGSTLTCTDSEMMGLAPSGSDLPDPLFSFTVTFNCTGPLGITATGTVTGEFYAETPTSGTPVTVNGYIVVNSATVTINSLIGTCTATITPGGTVGMADNGVTYDNDTEVIEIPAGTSSTLTIGYGHGFVRNSGWSR